MDIMHVRLESTVHILRFPPIYRITSYLSKVRDLESEFPHTRFLD